MYISKNVSSLHGCLLSFHLVVIHLSGSHSFMKPTNREEGSLRNFSQFLRMVVHGFCGERCGGAGTCGRSHAQ